MSAPSFVDPAVAGSQGYRSPNYQGSYQQWVYRVSRSMADRYMRGDQGMLDGLSGATGGIGQPDGADFGSAAGGKTGTISYQTYDFFEKYVSTYARDPWVTGQFGPPPSVQATWEDPNVTTGGTYTQRAADAAAQAALDRQRDIDVATIGANASRYAADQQLAGVRERVGADIQVATMQDATARYIAEGNWGVQKYVAQLQESGALERLKLELGQRDEELAQQAVAERDRHHEAMVGLIMEVAKYDSELGSKPRNWPAYALWLQNRGEVVNALNLATVAQLMPETEMDPASVANAASGSPAAGVAAISAYQTSQAQTAAASVQGATGAQDLRTATGGPSTQAPAPTAAATPPAQAYSYNGIDLNNQNYTQLANQILGLGGAGSQPASKEQLQAMYDSTATAGNGRAGSYSGWGGAGTNAVGVNVNTMGQKEDFRRFSSLLPSQQEIRVGGAESAGVYAPDYVEQMQRSRPKGAASGAAAWG